MLQQRNFQPTRQMPSYSSSLDPDRSADAPATLAAATRKNSRRLLGIMPVLLPDLRRQFRNAGSTSPISTASDSGLPNAKYSFRYSA